MNYAARFGPCPIDPGVHRGLDRGFEGAFEYLPVEVHEHDIFRLQDCVVEAARGYEYVAVGGAGADVPRGAHTSRDLYYLSSQIQIIQACSPSRANEDRRP